MIVDVSTFLPSTPKEIEQHLKTSSLLIYVAAPLVKFIPCGDTQLPELWENGTYWVVLRLFGFIPLGKQAVVISYPDNPKGFSIRDNGHSMLINRWDHRMTLEPSGVGTLYRDHVIIEAGVFTIFIWAFAQLFYRHRQRRWRKLVANGLSYAAT
jgi:hypothetical protein